MSRLLCVPIVGVIVLTLGWWEQPSADAGADRCARCMLSPTSSDARDCSVPRYFLKPRMTNGTLGGECAAQRRVRTNCSPRP